MVRGIIAVVALFLAPTLSVAQTMDTQSTDDGVCKLDAVAPPPVTLVEIVQTRSMTGIWATFAKRLGNRAVREAQDEYRAILITHFDRVGDDLYGPGKQRILDDLLPAPGNPPPILLINLHAQRRNLLSRANYELEICRSGVLGFEDKLQAVQKANDLWAFAAAIGEQSDSVEFR